MCNIASKFELLVLIVASLTSVSFAQTDSSAYFRFTLIDDTEIIAKVDSLTPDAFKIITASGMNLVIKKSQVKLIEELDSDLSRQKIFQTDPNDYRLFLSPTARSLPAGNVQFVVCEIFFPVVSVGITDYLMLSGGMSLIPGAEIDEQVRYLSAKVTPLKISNFQFSFNSTYFSSWDNNDFTTAFATATFFSGKFAFTTGLGFGYSQKDIFKSPVIILGAEIRMTDNSKIITENWLWDDEDLSIFSFGVRFFNQKIAGDLGFLFPRYNSNSSGFIPWLGFSYTF